MDTLKREKEEKNQILTCLATHLATDTSMPVCHGAKRWLCMAHQGFVALMDEVGVFFFEYACLVSVVLKMNEMVFGEDNC